MTNAAAKPDLSASPRAVWRLTWPQMLMMYLFFFTGIITVWAAGRMSSEVQASFGLVTQCMIFIMVVIMSVSSGATAAITQSIGMGKLARARLYVFATLAGAVGLGVVMAIPAWIFGDSILALIQAPESIMPVCRRIWQVAVIGLPAQYVYSSSGVLFRATRLVFPPLWVSALVCAANFFAALGFGLGYFGLPNFGYMGLVWANIGSQTLGAVANCYLFYRSGYLRFKPLPTIPWLKRAMPYLLKVAAAAGAAQIVWQSGYLTLFVLVASLPRDSVAALAGLTAGLRAEGLLFMPAMAFHMTCAVLVGNSLGQGDERKAKRVGLFLTAAASAFMSVIALCLWPFRADIAAALSTDAATRLQIVSYLSYNLVSTPFSIASQVMGGIMVGAGATLYNLVIYGGAFWGIRLPLGWLLGHRLWGSANGVFAAMLVSQVVQTIVMLVAVVRGRWTRFAMKKNLQKK